MSSLHRGDSVFLTAWLPFSTSPYLEPISRRWLVRSSFTHLSQLNSRLSLSLHTGWVQKQKTKVLPLLLPLFFPNCPPGRIEVFFWLQFSFPVSSSSFLVNRIYFRYRSSLSLSVSIKLATVSLTCALTLAIGCCCHLSSPRGVARSLHHSQSH